MRGFGSVCCFVVLFSDLEICEGIFFFDDRNIFDFERFC